MYFCAEVGQENLIGSLLDFHSNLVNWVLLLVILFLLIKQYVPAAISKRKLSINNELAQAAKTLQDAQTALADQKRQVEQAWQTAEQIVVEARQAAKQMSEEIKLQSEKEMSDLFKKFELAAHNERQAAVLEMRAIAARAAIKLAEENLRTTLTGDDRNKIAGDFMDELRKINQINMNEPITKNGGNSGNHSSIQARTHIGFQHSDSSHVDKTNRSNRSISEQNLVDS